jgi:uncharacterized protein
VSNPPGSIPHAESLPERMRRDLTEARRARDRSAVSALRTTLAAMANAEADELERQIDVLSPYLG